MKDGGGARFFVCECVCVCVCVCVRERERERTVYLSKLLIYIYLPISTIIALNLWIMRKPGRWFEGVTFNE